MRKNRCVPVGLLSLAPVIFFASCSPTSGMATSHSISQPGDRASGGIQDKATGKKQIASQAPNQEATFAGISFVWCPAGEFMMGSANLIENMDIYEKPSHQVTIGVSFWMGKYEVTQGQWQAVMGSNPSDVKGEMFPVTNVSWTDCHDFINILNGKGEGTFRLPTEAEWEYACRAGTQTTYYWGNDPEKKQIVDYAWCITNSMFQPHPVGQKPANAWGIHDMAGNVQEVCEDDWHENYSQAPMDGRAWTDSPRGRYRVLRGSSWKTPNSSECRSSGRTWDGDIARGSSNGFRLVRIK